MNRMIVALTLLLILSIHINAQEIGKIVVNDPVLHTLIDANAKIEILAEGYHWSEGPVWVKDSNYVLFSDVPANTIYKWKKGEEATVFLSPSGYSGRYWESAQGSNGLIINTAGKLVSAEHGDRRLSEMPLHKGAKVTIADKYDGKRFNSPNDVVQKSNGDYYFTDPPYGLQNDSTREISANGVYKTSLTGEVVLLLDSLLPNGLAFSPDEKYLYIGQSDNARPYILSYEVRTDGTLFNGKILFDVTPLFSEGLQGGFDGLKVDVHGNIFAAGPKGVFIISPAGKLLGRIETGVPTANCAWGDDGSILYITSQKYLLSVRTKTKGVGFE